MLAEEATDIRSALSNQISELDASCTIGSHGAGICGISRLWTKLDGFARHADRNLKRRVGPRLFG